MCKFSNRLFVFVLFDLLWGSLGWPAAVVDAARYEDSLGRSGDLSSLVELLVPESRYDQHYDQRQKGSENYRLKLDGFFIGLPAEEDSFSVQLSDHLLETIGEGFLLSSGKNEGFATSAPEHESSDKELSSPTPKSSSATSAGLDKVAMEEPTGNEKEVEARNRPETVALEETGRRPATSPRLKSHLQRLLQLLKRPPRY